MNSVTYLHKYTFEYYNSLKNKYLFLYETFPSEIVDKILSYLPIEDIYDLSNNKDESECEYEYDEYDEYETSDFTIYFIDNDEKIDIKEINNFFY